jgi:hypothetical protein
MQHMGGSTRGCYGPTTVVLNEPSGTVMSQCVVSNTEQEAEAGWTLLRPTHSQHHGEDGALLRVMQVTAIIMQVATLVEL